MAPAAALLPVAHDGEDTDDDDDAAALGSPGAGGPVDAISRPLMVHTRSVVAVTVAI